MSFWELVAVTGGPFLLGFGFGWEFHKSKTIREKEEALRRVQEKYEENKRNVEEKFRDRSSDDIIDEYLGRKRGGPES